jgi:hypothetical protein
MLSLGDACGSKESVGPLKLAIAIFGRPVALLLIRERNATELWRETYVPGFCAIERFCDVVVPFPVTSN